LDLWIKYNGDGLAKGVSGRPGCGKIIEIDLLPHWSGCLFIFIFFNTVKITFTLHAELMAALMATEIARDKG